MSNSESMQKYVVRPTTDHDKKVKLGKHTLLCYSKEQLKQLHPAGDYTILGETADKSKAEKVASLIAGSNEYSVAKFKSHNRLLFSHVGYVKVGEGEYIALLHNRLLFLILLFSGIGAAVVLLLLLLSLLEPQAPVVIDPAHPLPSQDDNAQKLEDDNSQRPEVEEGGGSLSMIYTLVAKYSLSTGQIDIYFKNPNASTHDVSIILYITSGDQEIAIAQSGLLKAGYGLETLEFAEGTAKLSEGIYEGKYLLSLFDPATGERALVQPEITGVTVTVVP